ncbi:MAG: hypothetical protein ACFFDI_28800, partial [Promethearchaeota archaeon]
KKQGFKIIPKVLELTCDLMNLMSGLWYIIQAARFRSTPNLASEQEISFLKYIALAQERFLELKLTKPL